VRDRTYAVYTARSLKPATHDPSLSADNVGCYFDVILSVNNVRPCVTLSAMFQGCLHCRLVAKMTTDSDGSCVTGFMRFRFADDSRESGTVDTVK